MGSGRYETIEEIEAVVHSFERCEYGVHEFDHSKHMAVAAWYLRHFSFEGALGRMRCSLLRFTEHHGVKGYHETITRFWLELAAGNLLVESAGRSLVEQVNELIRKYGDKNTLFDYYTREVVMSEEARERWVEPDLKQFPHTPAQHSAPPDSCSDKVLL